MKKGLLMSAVLLAAVVIGSLIGDFARGVASLSWLGKIFDIGISTFDLNLKIFVITLGFRINICVSEILMIIVGLLCYPRLSKWLFE
ncbi:MAG: DUF4321 domain-containing protein [Oscillospiraceae bacterium]|nr:DUF4321 domain-containing protein [Oscillospiraceae bacterium]